MKRKCMKVLALLVLVGWSLSAMAQPPIWETSYGVDLALSDDDTADVALGDFAFPFQGNTYTGTDIINVSSNGFISINGDNGNDCCQGERAEFVGDPFGRIAVFWADLNPGDSGGVFVNTFDDDSDTVTDRLVVTWDTVLFDNSLPIAVQAQLFDDGTIILGYNGYRLANFNDDTLVGVTPGGGVSDPGGTDFTANAPFDSGTQGTVYEFWEGDPPPVDIDQYNIIFSPNGIRGWFVTVDVRQPLPVSTLTGSGLGLLAFFMLLAGLMAVRMRIF